MSSCICSTYKSKSPKGPIAYSARENVSPASEHVRDAGPLSKQGPPPGPVQPALHLQAVETLLPAGASALARQSEHELPDVAPTTLEYLPGPQSTHGSLPDASLYLLATHFSQGHPSRPVKPSPHGVLSCTSPAVDPLDVSLRMLASGSPTLTSSLLMSCAVRLDFRASAAPASATLMLVSTRILPTSRYCVDM